ncbi:aldo/keto reductase [uncultured Sphingomonas sp.]|uniref:aldo/keto reductase n=1 Tax=uncultured Sphingomonas sp. TaxID=158754 RepID=UPI0035C9E122
MELRPYGDTGLMVSPLCYGAMTIAQDPELRNGVAPSLLRALEGGVRIIDTARVYPNSETIVAATLKAWRGERPVISTKVAPGSAATFREYRPIAEAYTPDGIRRSVEDSLAALGAETLDIAHLHQWWHLWSYEDEIFDTFDTLRREGKIRHAAISVGDHEHDAALEVVSRRRVSGLQLILNLFESRPLASILPLARLRGVGVIARCALDSGGLSGTLTGDDFRARPFLKYAPFDEYAARLHALSEYFVPTSAPTLADLALRFALFAPGVSAVTIGMPSVAMVEACLEAVRSGPLPDEVMTAIRREHVWTKNFYERLL